MLERDELQAIEIVEIATDASDGGYTIGCSGQF
jgi:hypothetical protein